MRTQSIQIELIRRDGGTQPRAEINSEFVERYRERMEEGDKLPPVIVFYDGTDYWLADGFHRVMAVEAAGWMTIDCDVRQGDRRAAQFYSFSANKTNGIPRDKGDIRRAVEAMLSDSEWAMIPQTKIAEHVGCSQQFVSQVRAGLHLTSTSKMPDRSSSEVTRNGKTYQMNTANIGRKSAPVPPVVESEKTVINTDTGEVIENAAVVTTRTETVAVRGRGIELAHEAINTLKRIPVTDALRGEGLDTVARWIRDNR